MFWLAVIASTYNKHIRSFTKYKIFIKQNIQEITWRTIRATQTTHNANENQTGILDEEQVNIIK